MPIRRLPQSLINKIAAGEVIERPASVVKELLENAVDAGARRIDVSITSGGLELIRVADDGCGIPADELPLAVAPHATSKLQSPEDLFRVRTLGFRGEALASIAEVSRLLIRSRTADSTAGAQLEVEGGTAGQVVPCASPVGTVVEVRDLFFNTPVRRRFLRSAQTELGHVCEAFTRVALATPEVHLTLEHNGRLVFELEAAEGLQHRIARLFGHELAEALIGIRSSDGPVSISGYVAPPTHSRSHNRMQYFFLNGRYIRDRALQHALGEAYRGLLTTGRYPIAFLVLSMPPEMVDVNVHPTKLEVRFQDGGALYSQLLTALRSKFLTTDMAPRLPGNSLRQPGDSAAIEAARQAEQLRLRQQVVDWAKAKMASWPTAATAGEEAAAQAVFNVGRGLRSSGPLLVQRIDRLETAASPGGPHTGFPARQSPEASTGITLEGVISLEDAARGNLGRIGDFSPSDGREAPYVGRETAPGSREMASSRETASSAREMASSGGEAECSGREAAEVAAGYPTLPSAQQAAQRAAGEFGVGQSAAGRSPDGQSPGQEFASSAAGAPVQPRQPGLSGKAPLALQIHNKYLVTETAEGVMVIDQHALHERILYEHLRRKIQSGPIEVQNLLQPEPVDLTPAEAAAALEHRALLGELGIGVEPFGGSTVLITGFPAMLAKLDPVELLRSLVAELVERDRPPERLEMLDRLLHTIACKAAVKSGDRLTEEEIHTLLAQRHLVAEHHHCPHGRPTAVILTREELDRHFGR